MSPTLPTIEPLHELSLEGLGEAQSVVLSPSGPVLYVQVTRGAVDLLLIAAVQWPYWAGVLLALATLWALRRAVRVFRSPRRTGVPHCGRCGYELSGAELGATGAVCPECGVLLSRRRPVPGRSSVRRLVPTLAVYALCLAAAGVALACVPLRPKKLPPGWTWRSVTVAELVSDRAWFAPYRKQVHRVLELDARTGRVLRTLAQVREISGHLVVSPDGSELMVGGAGSPWFTDYLWRISTASGRVRRSPSFGFELGGTLFDDVAVFSFSENGSIAYVQGADGASSTSRVAAFDRRSGAITPLGSTLTNQDRMFTWARAYAAVPGQPLRFVSFPCSMEVISDHPFTLRLHDFSADAGSHAAGGAADGGNVVPPAPVDDSTGVVFGPGADELFTQEERGGNLLILAFPGGEQLATVPLPEPGSGVGELRRSPTGRYLAVAGDRAIFLYDTTERVWTHGLPIPAHLSAPRAVFCPRGEYLAAVLEQRVGRGPPEVVVWELPEGVR